MDVKKIQSGISSQGNLKDALDNHRRTAKDISALNRKLDIAKKLSDTTLGQLGVSENIIG